MRSKTSILGVKNIFKIFSFEKLKEISNRFPISMIILFIVATIFFILLHYENTFTGIGEKLMIANFSLIMTFIFSIAVYLTSENSNKTKLQRNLFQIIPLLFGIIFYNVFSLDSNDFENFLFFFLSFTGIIAYLFFSPYLKNLISLKKDPETSSGGQLFQSIFYTYFYNISVVILISFIFAGVLFGLGAIGITATDALFDLDINEKKTYGNWAILSLSIITPLFTLSQIPNKESFLKNYFNENVFFSFLIKFVATPFMYLYFFILYAYTVKVLLNFSDWPKGEVSWLVIGFSIFGYIAYMFSYIFEGKNKLIKNFRKIFPLAVIPQIFILFYAIYLRVNQYDITVNRYFVIVFGLWLLTLSLYFVFSKKKKLIAVPSLLALFIIIISVVPWINVYSFPETRQLSRLETNLKEAGILKDTETSSVLQRIIPLKNYNDISQNLSKNIYSGISYLCDFNSCENIKKLFPKIYTEIEEKDKQEWKESIEKQIKQKEENKDKKECDYKKSKYGYYDDNNCYNKKQIEILKKQKYKGLSKWLTISKITERIKVKRYFGKNEGNKKYFNFSKDYKQDFFPINTKGYSKIYRISSYDKWDKRKDYAEYNTEKQVIIIKEGDIEFEKISTKEITKKLIKIFGKDDNRNLKKQDLIFELKNGKYKLFFENINILNPDYKEKEKDSDGKDVMSISNMGGYTAGYLLIKD